MKLPHRNTLSFCGVCYKEIPAVIAIESGGVWMRKRCNVHGDQEALVERDPLFYTYVLGLRAKEIYPGHFVDVTRTCNLRCAPCFYPLVKKDPAKLFDVEEILNECESNRHRQRFHFTGGEPTLHPKLPEIIRRAQAFTKLGKAGVELVTNGVRLSDAEYYEEVMPLLTTDEGIACVNMSIHWKETDKWRPVLERVKEDGIKLQSILIVCDDEFDFEKALEIAKAHKDSFAQVRFKGASKMWNEKRPATSADKDTPKVYVSDMLKWLEKRGAVHHILPTHNKPMFFNVYHDGMHCTPVAWHDTQNVDLHEIDCPPTYRARNGEVCNLVTANLINEGMANGWVKGQPIHRVAAESSVNPEVRKAIVDFLQK